MTRHLEEVEEELTDEDNDEGQELETPTEAND